MFSLIIGGTDLDRTVCHCQNAKRGDSAEPSTSSPGKRSLRSRIDAPVVVSGSRICERTRRLVACSGRCNDVRRIGTLIGSQKRLISVKNAVRTSQPPP